jgi:hypothetical protein
MCMMICTHDVSRPREKTVWKSRVSAVSYGRSGGLKRRARNGEPAATPAPSACSAASGRHSAPAFVFIVPFLELGPLRQLRSKGRCETSTLKIDCWEQFRRLFSRSFSSPLCSVDTEYSDSYLFQRAATRGATPVSAAYSLEWASWGRTSKYFAGSEPTFLVDQALSQRPSLESTFVTVQFARLVVFGT